MTKNELKKLSRLDLLEMLLDQSKKVEELEKKLSESEEALHNKEIMIDQAGSIAEAALQLNGVFEAAQQACQQYTDNVKQLSERQEVTCARIEEESRAEAERLISEAEKESERLLSETKRQCEEMVSKAEAQTQAYWDNISDKLEQFYQEHVGLRDLLAVLSNNQKKE